MVNTKTVRSMCTVLATIVVWSALFFCAPNHSHSAETTPLTPVILQLKWIHQFQFAGFYAAEAKGFYKEEGLTVTFRERRPGMKVINEVMDGNADFGVSDPEALLDYLEGKPVVVLGAIFQHSPNVLLTHADSNIKKPKDLRGKRVMLLGSMAAPIWAMLNSQGVSKSDLKLQALTWRVDELVNGETDALSAYLTDQPYELNKMGIPTNVIRPISFGIDFYGDCLITTEQLAENNPDLVERFTRASFKGWEYAMAHSDEIADLIISRHKSTKTKDQLHFEAEAMRELILPRLIPPGSMNPRRWAHIAKVYRTLGMTDSKRPLDEFIYETQEQRELKQLSIWAPYGIMAGAIISLGILVLFIFNRKLQKGIEARTMELDRNRQSLRQVLDLVPNMVYAKDNDGRFIMANRAVAEAFGTTVDDLIDQLHTDVHKDAEQAAQMLADDQVVFETNLPKVTLEEDFRHADGTVHWLQTTRLPFISASTGESAVLVLSVDITNRRQAEAALKKSEEDLRILNERLEERVADRTKNLEEAKAQLEQSLEQLKETQKELILSEKLAALGGLVAGVAHEINTPLGVGVTASSFLEERLIELSRKYDNEDLKRSDLEKFIRSGKESASNIHVNLIRAAELIKSFKQVAADQSSEMPRQFNLNGYVDEVLLSLRPKYKRTDHTIINDTPDVELYSYPGAFMQIITNLLLNSLTHAYDEGEAGTITISGSVKGDTLEFTFSDDGKGIPPELTDKVFEPFYTTRRGKGGTGLGLHIIHNAVTQMLNGSIHFESPPGKGTAYTITMPLDRKSPGHE